MRPPRSRRPGRCLALSCLALFVSTATPLPADSKPRPDAVQSARNASPAVAELERLGRDPVLARIGTVRHIDERSGVPRFLVARRGPETTAVPGATAEAAARQHLARLAPYYRLDASDVQTASLRYLNRTGTGGVIAVFRQDIDGVPVFRDEIKVLLDRSHNLLAVTGSIPGRAAVRTAAFRLDATDAVAAALADRVGAGVGRGLVRRTGSADGGYETFEARELSAARLSPSIPIRARRVFYREADQLVPAWHVELTAEDTAPTYVIAAEDARILLHHDRVLRANFSYRVWADATIPFMPLDGPHGNGATPYPTPAPSSYYPAFVPPVLINLQNGPISTNDPWLAPGATTTSGNNVDAYADFNAPDGFSAGDLRATTTSPGVFDRIYDVNQQPDASANQRMASVTGLFYLNNFLHDWFYDAGFDEAAGNAQVSNYGRGGLGGDGILAEAQDHSGFDNASMQTPADGASPRMQMQLWNPGVAKTVTVNSPPRIAGPREAAGAATNAATVNLTGPVALPNPGTFAATSTSPLITAASPRNLQIADMNGDQIPDLVVACYTANSVYVILANGSGGYLPGTLYSTGSGPSAVVTPDLNNDGKRDVVSVNFTSGSITTRLGTGTGTLGSASSVFAGTNATAIATARFNADGNDDIVTANFNGNNIAVFLGNGSGGYAPRVDYPMGVNPLGVAVGDLNGDGFVDVVSANTESDNLSVRLGTGTGTFGAVANYTIGDGPQTVALGDLNLDGRLDAIVGNRVANTVAVALGNGTGGFGTASAYAVPPRPISVAVEDMNGDGLLDVVVASDVLSNSVSILAGNGSGTLGAPQTLAAGANPNGVKIADINGDFHPDIVTANADASTLSLMYGWVTPSTASCAPFANTMTGRIAVIDRGVCNFNAKFAEAQLRGAAGVIIVNNVPGVSEMPTTPPTSIPGFMVTTADGDSIRAALRTGSVNVTLTQAPSLLRDSAVDHLIVAHEWGHYLSNRLIGDGSGLTNRQGAGLGEGWSDFVALLMAVKPEDAAVASNPDWGGSWAAAGHARASSVTTNNAYYFGNRRYPYSTDMSKNPLSFAHINEFWGWYPEEIPRQEPADPSPSSPHNTGEVWCTALWECYASLLRDSGRLTFAQARDRMRMYLVQSLQMTPANPTFLEARDALLTVAYAGDPVDHDAFCAAFARRGMGRGAAAPDRWSVTQDPVVESYECGGDLELVAIALDDSIRSCDNDGVLDANEEGRLAVTLANPFGSVEMSATTATIAITHPGLSFPLGNTITFPVLAPGMVARASVPVKATGSGIQPYTFNVQYDDPDLAAPGPYSATFSALGNVDGSPSATDLFGWSPSAWTVTGDNGPSVHWSLLRPDTTSSNHAYFVPNAGLLSDQRLTSPPLQVGAGPFSFTFKHRHSFEFEGAVDYDGGVVEISTDGGANWADIGAGITPGYNGTISTDWENPIGGRSAFTRTSPGYPAWTTATANLGTTYAGQTVRIRFRFAEDLYVGVVGWTIDEVGFSGIVGTPFTNFVADPGPCVAVGVGEELLPREIAFSVVSANPSRGSPTFRFALPSAQHVTIALYDVAGRRVVTLADGSFGAGVHTASWNGPAEVTAGPGVYFARMTTGGKVFDRRLVILK